MVHNTDNDPALKKADGDLEKVARG